MAFFNTNPNAGQINQLNKQMNQTLGMINGKYTEMGRIVKLRYLDRIDDPDVKRIAAEIDNMLASLQAMNKQINLLKGLRECPGCHIAISTGVAFCPNCGTKQPVAPAPAPVQGFAQPAPQPVAQPAPQPVVQPVPQMMQPAPQPAPQPEVKSVIEDAPAPAPQPVPVPAPAPSANAPQFIFCTSCGNKEAAGTKFCSECGAVIEE